MRQTIKTVIALGLALAVALLAAAPAAAQGTMFVKNDAVGIGDFSASNPAAKLHLKVGAANANIRLQRSGSTWAFTINSSDFFTVNKIGSGGQEFTVRERLNGDGQATMTVAGDIDASAFNVTSSRALKTGFVPVDSGEILERFVQVPVTQWQFQTDGSGRSHIGPMAEDFQAAFGLGDGQTISLTDASGITMAAVQGLHANLQDKEREIDALKQQVESLETLVRSLIAER